MCLSNTNLIPHIAILRPKTVYKVFMKTDDPDIIESAIRNTPYRIGQMFTSKLIREWDTGQVNFGIHSFANEADAQHYVNQKIRSDIQETFTPSAYRSVYRSLHNSRWMYKGSYHRYIPLDLYDDELPENSEYECPYVIVRCEIPTFHRYYLGDWGENDEYTSIASTALTPIEVLSIYQLDKAKKKYREKYDELLKRITRERKHEEDLVALEQAHLALALTEMRESVDTQIVTPEPTPVEESN